jgi:putative inorganic carbon (HCO3(-)) transporter
MEDRISTDFRLGFWRDSLPLLADYAVTGCGLGAFESVYPRYQRTGAEYRIEYMHNDILQSLVELGVPVFLIGVWLTSSLMARMSRAIWFGAEARDRFISIACICSSGGMLLHSLVDFNLHVPANAMTLSWILGLGFSTRSVKDRL